MKELTVDASIDKIPEITEFVDAELEAVDCPMKAQMQIDVAIDELFSNIAYYAYPQGSGKATVQVETSADSASVAVRFIDKGVPYNPLEKDDPDVTLSAEDRGIGGLGIYMVKKSMNEVTYEYEEESNKLTIIKKW